MKIIRFKPTYRREDGLTVIYDPSVPFPEDFENKIRGIVVFPPGSKGGNHKHPRMEVFYSTGDLTLVYLNSDGKKKEISMAPKAGMYKLFIIPPHLAHAVVNKTRREAVMVEYANEEQHDVEPVILV